MNNLQNHCMRISWLDFFQTLNGDLRKETPMYFSDINS